MKKTWTLLSLTLALYGANSFGGTAGAVFEEKTPWTGFYVGANAGYLWSANNRVTNLGAPYYANPLFSPDSNLMSASFGRLDSRSISVSTNGFIGGGQAGYNALILDHLVIGLDVDLDAIAQSNSTADFVNTVSIPPLPGSHVANISVTKKLDYLGMVKGRLGHLLKPNVLVYGAGAFAYGKATMQTSYRVANTQAAFLPMHDQASESNVLGGWAAGGGAEWALTPNWSVKAEYMYYNLGPVDSYLNLNQYIATNPPTLYAASTVKVKTYFTGNTARVGVNYHFG